MKDNNLYTITGIEDKAGSFIYKITLDEDKCLIINRDVFEEMDLKIGSNVDLKSFMVEVSQVEEKIATEKSLTYLEHNWRTEKQVKGYLKRKGFSTATIEDVILRLKASGYINDTAYANVYVQNRSEGRGESKNRISKGLFIRGIDANTAKMALSGIQEEDELAKAYEVIRKYKKSNSSLAKPEFNKKVYSALQYRGFTSHISIKALKTVTDELDEEEGDSGP